MCSNTTRIFITSKSPSFTFVVGFGWWLSPSIKLMFYLNLITRCLNTKSDLISLPRFYVIWVIWCRVLAEYSMILNWNLIFAALKLPSVSINSRKDEMLFLHSSGTTGFPKAVVHTHYSFIALLESLPLVFLILILLCNFIFSFFRVYMCFRQINFWHLTFWIGTNL